MTLKTEQKERSRGAILASAAALLRERGVRASSVMDVMRGAGLTVGGFYGHFDSKEALFAQTIREVASAKWDALLESARGDSGPARVVDVVRKYVSRLHRDSPAEGCLLPTTVPDAALEDGAPYRPALAEELTYFSKSLATMLEGDPSAKEKALGLVVLMYGALSLSRGLKGTALSDEVLSAARKFAASALED